MQHDGWEKARAENATLLCTAVKELHVTYSKFLALVPTHIKKRKQIFYEFLACVPCDLSRRKIEQGEVRLNVSPGIKASAASSVVLYEDMPP